MGHPAPSTSLLHAPRRDASSIRAMESRNPSTKTVRFDTTTDKPGIFTTSMFPTASKRSISPPFTSDASSPSLSSEVGVASDGGRLEASSIGVTDETFDNANLDEILEATTAEELDRRETLKGFAAGGNGRKSLGIVGPSLRVVGGGGGGGVGGRRVTGVASVVARTWQQQQPTQGYFGHDTDRTQKRASIYAGAVRIVKKSSSSSSSLFSSNLPDDDPPHVISSPPASPRSVTTPPTAATDNELWKLLNPSAAVADKALGLDSAPANAAAGGKLRRGVEDYFSRKPTGATTTTTTTTSGQQVPKTPAKGATQRAFTGSVVTPRRVPIAFLPPTMPVATTAVAAAPPAVASAPLNVSGGGEMKPFSGVTRVVAAASAGAGMMASPGRVRAPAGGDGGGGFGTPRRQGFGGVAVTPRRVPAVGVVPGASARKMQYVARSVGMAFLDGFSSEEKAEDDGEERGGGCVGDLISLEEDVDDGFGGLRGKVGKDRAVLEIEELLGSGRDGGSSGGAVESLVVVEEEEEVKMKSCLVMTPVVVSEGGRSGEGVLIPDLLTGDVDEPGLNNDLNEEALSLFGDEAVVLRGGGGTDLLTGAGKGEEVDLLTGAGKGEEVDLLTGDGGREEADLLTGEGVDVEGLKSRIDVLADLEEMLEREIRMIEESGGGGVLSLARLLNVKEGGTWLVG
ncbi:hypothetical protein HDU67_003435 [Dinochytrium kinnereticum]|nr:hypothetical protein HDU67_003435 [Dinochytrium kinnereticum]